MFGRWFKVGFIALIVAVASGCAVTEGSGVPASETRTVGRFDRLEIRGVNARIEVDPAATTETIEVKGDDNLVRKVRAGVEDGKLVVDTGHDDVDPELPLEVVFTTPSLTKIEAIGGTRIQLKLENDATLRIDAIGRSRITPVGRVARLEANLVGSSRLDARYLVAKTVDLDLAGHGFASVCATESLEADVAGDSQAEYYCSPSRVDHDVSSGSELHAR